MGTHACALGPETHVVAVCQPAPAVIAAVSLLASRGDPAQPRSMVLMGGPVDTRAARPLSADVFLKKPLDFDRLLELVRGYCAPTRG